MAHSTSVAAPEFYARLREQLIKAVVGQEEAIRLCAVALVASLSMPDTRRRGYLEGTEAPET